MKTMMNKEDRDRYPLFITLYCEETTNYSVFTLL